MDLKKRTELRVLIISIFVTFLFSEQLSLPVLFKKGFYTQICNKRWVYINKYVHKREDLLSIVAYSCLKKGYLTPALDLAKVLNTTSVGRKNATYITTLFLMKKLLLEALFDNNKGKNIKLPEIKDNMLGVVFSYWASGKYRKEDNTIVINDKNKKFVISVTKYYNLLIKMYLDNNLIKKEKFW